MDMKNDLSSTESPEESESSKDSLLSKPQILSVPIIDYIIKRLSNNNGEASPGLEQVKENKVDVTFEKNMSSSVETGVQLNISIKTDFSTSSTSTTGNSKTLVFT